MRLTLLVQSWLLGLAMLLLRITCRVTVHNDPRQRLKANSELYAFSILHAHQLSAAIKRESGTAAMVSQSGDGQLLMPGFWLLRIKAVRGSNRRQDNDKGGRTALNGLIAHVKTGSPAILAVDGPRGPRGQVRKGIAVLSKESGAAVLNVVAIPTRRWILRGTWDRLQIPQPFCRIHAYFAEPLRQQENESVEAFRRRIESSLRLLEETHDPEEAARVSGAASAKSKRRERGSRPPTTARHERDTSTNSVS